MNQYICILCDKLYYSHYEAGTVLPLLQDNNGLCVCRECQEAIKKLKD